MKTAINHFRVWVIRMGFNQKQITAAANTIGIQNSVTASLTFNGKRELTLTERLAMSARRAGLQPWTRLRRRTDGGISGTSRCQRCLKAALFI